MPRIERRRHPAQRCAKGSARRSSACATPEEQEREPGWSSNEKVSSRSSMVSSEVRKGLCKQSAVSIGKHFAYKSRGRPEIPARPGGYWENDNYNPFFFFFFF